MTSTPDIKSCVGINIGESAGAAFQSIRYHFGMLLGVSDFETEQAYHRGKIRLHNRWLHGPGVVWGFDVRTETTRGEIEVLPGLALDALGRELYLELKACLNVVAWFTAHRDDPGFEFTETATEITFDAHVVIRFKACLSRQVPALSEPCEGSGTSTAYSRVTETVEILFRPGLAPASLLPYHRLRLLFGLDSPLEEEGAVTPGDQEVRDASRDLQAFRRFAALDEIDLAPAEGDDFPVVLANVTGVTLTKNGEDLSLTAGTVDVSVRPAHVATSTIQELLAGKLSPVGGPIVAADSVQIDEAASTLTAGVSTDLAPASVVPGAFSLAWFDETTGWQAATIDAAAFDDATKLITLNFTGSPGGQLVRFVAQGSGPTPLLGVNLVPLNNGRDFVHMQKRS